MQSFGQYRQGIVIQIQHGDVASVIAFIKAMNEMLPESFRAELPEVPTEDQYGYEHRQLRWDWVHNAIQLVERAIANYLDGQMTMLAD